MFRKIYWFDFWSLQAASVGTKARLASGMEKVPILPGYSDGFSIVS